jgi:hypothetical protein
MKSLCKKYGSQRVEEVCAYARRTTRHPCRPSEPSCQKASTHFCHKEFRIAVSQKIIHENIRGASYYARILNESKEQSNDE